MPPSQGDLDTKDKKTKKLQPEQHTSALWGRGGWDSKPAVTHLPDSTEETAAKALSFNPQTGLPVCSISTIRRMKLMSSKLMYSISDPSDSHRIPIRNQRLLTSIQDGFFKGEYSPFPTQSWKDILKKEGKTTHKTYEQGSRDAKAYKESAIEDSLASLARQKLRGTKMLSGEKGIREGESCLALVQNPVVVGWPWTYLSWPWECAYPLAQWPSRYVSHHKNRSKKLLTWDSTG